MRKLRYWDIYKKLNLNKILIVFLDSMKTTASLMILVGFVGTFIGKLVLVSKGEKYFKKVLTFILLFGALRLISVSYTHLTLPTSDLV